VEPESIFILSVMYIKSCVALTGAVMIASAVAPAAEAATLYQLTGGTTSLTLDHSQLAGLGLTFSGQSGTVDPASGYSYGFGILPPSSDSVGSSFTFDYEGGFFNPASGSIEHTGSLSYAVAESLSLLSPFKIGDFGIGFDGVGFSVTDNYSTGTSLFNLAVNPASAILNGSNLTFNGDLLISSELNDILENASGNFDLNLTGAAIGSAQINATAAVIPTPALLPAVVGFLGAAWAKRRQITV
jgi:hypothetical protein